MWSVPVHRWLSACVHWPVLDAAARLYESPVPAPPAADMSNETEAAGGKGNEKKGLPRGWGLSVMCVFGVSMAFHEAVVFVAMRGTCWPFNTFLLTVAGTLILVWDRVFPVFEMKKDGMTSASADTAAAAAPAEVEGRGAGVQGNRDSDKKGPDDDDDPNGHGGAGAVTDKGGSSAVNAGRLVTPFGSRGGVAGVVFVILVQISSMIADTAAWLWWRAVFLKH